MSDGNAKVSMKLLCDKENSLAKRKSNKSGIDEFSQAIARIAVAQICESLGFQSVHESALNVLADVGIRYIRDVGRSASFYANLDNRCQSNLFDLIRGLEDLGSVEGFPSASEVGNTLSESGIVRDISRYVDQEEAIPFAYMIPSFPIVKERRLNSSFAQVEENPSDKHIPCWLPRFPDPETYLNSSFSGKNAAEAPVENKIQPDEELHKKVDRSLMTLQQRLICNGSEAGVAVEQGNVTNSRKAAETNPFLAPPLQFGKKDVSLPLLPAKLVQEPINPHQSHEIVENNVSTSDPSLLADVSGRSGPFEYEDTAKILLHERPSVHFMLKNGKNSVATSRSSYNKNTENISLWFANDCERKDGKKSRAEQILWENIEKSHEVSPLYIRHDD